MRVTRITSYPPSSIGFASTCSTAGKTLTPWLSILSTMLLFPYPRLRVPFTARAQQASLPILGFVSFAKDEISFRIAVPIVYP